ncbi:metalloprotease 1 [Ophiocordyceps sinensis CO18]|uniref:Metalloprotease 1 n=1 Tax=Ophiocordyceps sinensis (strain Co18 / CGMCC 3.14243) TaxID=911162 RepID=T5APK0_OPHSC|nr:metalloprotease 1 [Ophiocordyceps sinensis CO18]
MLPSTSTLIFGLLAKATRTATVPTDPEPVNEGFCDTEEPPEELLATHQDPSIQDPSIQDPSIQDPSIQDAVTARALDQSESREPLKVDLYVHVVARSRKSKAYLDRGSVQKQVEILNDAYASADISFTMRDVDWTLNSEWAEKLSVDDEGPMKEQLRQGDKDALNIYTLESLLSSRGTNGAGRCRFPSKLDDTNGLALDGCLVRANTLPGGARKGPKYGNVAIHEVGHWFGLRHTFRHGAKAVKTCSESRLARNYMHNSPWQCRREFTEKQIARMHDMWHRFRA